MNNLNERVSGIYIITGIRIRKTQAGVGFITATLIHSYDRTPCIIWNDITAVSVDIIDGSFVYVSGIVTEYRNKMQLNLDYICKMAPSAVPNVAEIVPTAPINVEACFANLVNTVQQMQDPGLRSVSQYTLTYLQDSLQKIPAAKSIHHAFVGGLLMHTTMMLQLAKAACDIYTSVPGREGVIDRDLLFAGVILHDIGKVIEFRCYECGLVADYTSEGRQFGHSLLGVRIINNICRMSVEYTYKVDQLKHLLLSHHGSTEFGAAAAPMTLEAVLLSQIDSIDSKTEAAIEALLHVKPGGFTENLYAFGGRQLYKPVDPFNEDDLLFTEETNDDWFSSVDSMEEDN